MAFSKMNTLLKSKILKLWVNRPDGMKHPIASEDQITLFEKDYTDIPEGYKWFLLECGAGVVGSEWLDGIADLSASHQKFRDECEISNGWNFTSQFIIGWDGTGSPIGLSPEGKVCVEHPGQSELEVLSESLANYLIEGLTD